MAEPHPPWGEAVDARGFPAVVATDLDGTLLRGDGSVSPYTLEVLERYVAAGGPAVASDPYASYRSGTSPPWTGHGQRLAWFLAEKIGPASPDVYLYASCRIKNVLVLYWGYAPNNDDGKNGPIPPDVIAEQVSEHLRIGSARLKYSQAV